MSRILAGLTMALFASGVYAQQEVELILEDSKPKVQTNIRKPVEEQPKAETPVNAQPTPAPEEVIVGIVNSRVLTLAEVNARVSQKYEDVVADIQSRVGGVVATIDPVSTGPEPVNPLEDSLEDDLVLEEQKSMIEKAMHLEEEAALQAWVEHSMLAEEARRQGLIISDEVFKERLADAEKQNLLSRKDVDEFLAEMRMTRQDYERDVYDALLIEKMLDRFIALNYSEEYLRAAYDRQPALYYEPRKFLIAHFTIALNGDESKDRIKSLRDLARDARSELMKGADPETLFAQDRFDNFPEGIMGAVPGYFTFYEGALPKIVEVKARDLKVGETSDVLVAQIRENGKIVPVSMHVVKILEVQEATGDTFESAKPAIHRALLEIARVRLLAQLRSARTHRVITNLGGIPPRLIPTTAQIIQAEAKAQPINLKMPPKS